MKAYLVMADGEVFEGKAFGCIKDTIGKLVFNTSMTGYQEILSDPSYFGQIITMTNPQIGNYGYNLDDNVSDKSYARGVVVRSFSDMPSNFRCEGNIDEYLKKYNIPGIYDIDTRKIAKKIRQSGTQNASIVFNDFSLNQVLKQINEYKIEKAVYKTTCQSPYVVFADRGKYKIGLFNYGFRKNMVNSLIKRSCDVTILPAFTRAKEVLDMNFDGIVLSNGPGDPAEYEDIIKEIEIIARSNVPIMGISLGHQILALSQGAKTEKLKFGHHGANHPVLDLKTKKCFITSQNHNYHVVFDSINKDIGEITYINLNDKSVEGIRYRNINAISVQFNPEGSFGPYDTEFLFDEFLENIIYR